MAPRAADRSEFAGLQHPQQPGLRLQRHVADLVQKQRAALRLLEFARRARSGTGERPALVPEQLAFDQFARNCRHVEGDERPRRPRPHVMDGARHQLLAGAAFAQDHHRQVVGHHPGDQTIDLLHRWRTPYQRRVVATEFAGIGLRATFERRRNRPRQFIEIKWFWQVIERALLGRPHCGRKRVLGAHDDHPQPRAQRQQPGDRIEAIGIGQDDIGDDDIAAPVLDQLDQPGRGLGQPHLIAGAGQCLADDSPDRGVVVGNDHGRGHAVPPVSRVTGNSTRKMVSCASPARSYSTTPP